MHDHDLNMQAHMARFASGSNSNGGSGGRILKGGVNNEPFDLVYKKADFLAAEEKQLSEARQLKIRRLQLRESRDAERSMHPHPASPLRTKLNARAMDAAGREKDARFLEQEQRRVLLERSKAFSEQVRESFGPGTVAAVSGTLGAASISYSPYSGGDRGDEGGYARSIGGTGSSGYSSYSSGGGRGGGKKTAHWAGPEHMGMGYPNPNPNPIPSRNPKGRSGPNHNPNPRESQSIPYKTGPGWVSEVRWCDLLPINFSGFGGELTLHVCFIYLLSSHSPMRSPLLLSPRTSPAPDFHPYV